MKKKDRRKPILEQPVIDRRLMRSAREMVFKPQPPKTFACSVCGTAGATEQSDGLCWVCLRLKVSAWHDVEHQAPMAE